MDNTKLIERARRYAGDLFSPGAQIVSDLADALVAAEAELTRERERVEEWRRIAATNRRAADEQRIATRAAVRDSVWSVMEDRLEDDIDLDLNDVTESARFNALVDSVVGAALAAAPVSLEAANTPLAQVIADALGWDWEPAPGVPSPVEAVSDVAADVAQHLSLEAVKAETNIDEKWLPVEVTEWRPVSTEGDDRG